MRIIPLSHENSRALSQLVTARRAAPAAELVIMEQRCDEHTYAQHRALGEALGLEDAERRRTAVSSNVCHLDEYVATLPMRVAEASRLATVIATVDPMYAERILHSRFTDHT